MRGDVLLRRQALRHGLQNRTQGGRHLLEQLRHLAHQAGVALHLAFVSVGQEEVAQQWRVRQRLDDAVHEARVSQVYQTAQTCKWRETD